MKRATLCLFGALAIGVVALVVLAAKTSENDEALNMGVGALLGLCSIAFAHHLNGQEALTKARKERLQEARGLARALAAEVGIFGHVLLAKGHALQLDIGTGSNNGEGTDPDDLLRFVELPSRVIFDANASKIPLLEVIEECGELSEKEEGFVEGVVGFYEGVADFRSAMSAAKLQARKVTPEEVSDVQKGLQSKAKFALTLSNRLKEFIQLSAS